MKAKGIVSRTSDKDGRFGIEIDGTWYNGFGEAPTKTGDLIEFEYVENPSKDGKIIWKNVEPESIEILEKSPQPKVEGNIDAKSRRRTDCYLRAVKLWTIDKIKEEEIEEYADRFVKYCENQ